MCSGCAHPHSHPGGAPHAPGRRRFLQGAAAGLGAYLLSPLLRPGTARADLPEDGGIWLAGDLHCHTVLSHDVWGGPDDDNTGYDEMYTWGWTAGEQIRIAETRGLHFLAITDHNRTDALRLPEYRSDVLTLLPGYEHSLPGGHAGVFVPSVDLLPAPLSHADGFRDATGLRRFVDGVHERGGITVLNHPFYGNESEGNAIAWGYDADASSIMDAVEVWNISWAARNDTIGALADPDNHLSLAWWEQEMLPRRRIPMVGGSDNHYRATTAAQGVGQPTTWVLAADRSTTALLDGIRAGRTTVSSQPPLHRGARLTIAATQGDEHGAVVGGEVAHDVPADVVVQVVNGEGSMLRIVASGTVVYERRVMAPTEEHRATVTLPAAGWVRAELYADRDYAMTALTSPIYATVPEPEPQPIPS